MASIQGIYIALFGRPADPQGLAFWTERTAGGTDLTDIIAEMAGTQEYLSRFERLTSTEVVQSIYHTKSG